jgi:hypothetical protein
MDHKYNKYKTKYINLKKTMVGGVISHIDKINPPSIAQQIVDLKLQGIDETVKNEIINHIETLKSNEDADIYIDVGGLKYRLGLFQTGDGVNGLPGIKIMDCKNKMAYSIWADGKYKNAEKDFSIKC